MAEGCVEQHAAHLGGGHAGAERLLDTEPHFDAGPFARGPAQAGFNLGLIAAHCDAVQRDALFIREQAHVLEERLQSSWRQQAFDRACRKLRGACFIDAQFDGSRFGGRAGEEGIDRQRDAVYHADHALAPEGKAEKFGVGMAIGAAQFAVGRE